MKKTAKTNLPRRNPARWLSGTVLSAAVLVPFGALAANAGTAQGSGANAIATGTATVAQLYAPSYIFPFFNIAQDTLANIDFQELLYRPLYWAPDEQGRMQLNPDVSAAEAPVFTNGGRSVTITLKDWKWSNGEPLQASDVTFFLNMFKAEKFEYGRYIGGQIPDNITSVHVDSQRQLTLTFNKVYSRDWLLLNQLSQITPMPLAWDVTGPGKTSHCATDVSDCAAVFKYLTGEAKTVTGYASNPLWGIVDGPWELSTFSTDGSFTIVPNPTYSGPVKPRLASVKYETFTSDASEYNVLRSGNQIDVGWLPLSDAPPKPLKQPVGRNPVAGYTVVPTAFWGAIALPLNFENPKVGAILRQTYVRQALQRTVDQKGYLDAFLSGYGSLQAGPVPSQPANDYQAPEDKSGGPLAFDLSKAKALLESHGWRIVPHGSDVCTRPGTAPSDCGAGIASGTTLSFTAAYVNTPTWIGLSMQQWKSDASQVGISLTLSSGPFSTVYGDTTPCTPKQAACSWEISNFDGIAYFAYPSGDLFFSKTAALNYGHYDDPTTNALIEKTLVDSSPVAMQHYDAYLADQVPMVWFPNPVDSLYEIYNGLHGVVPSATGSTELAGLTDPEYWYFGK